MPWMDLIDTEVFSESKKKSKSFVVLSGEGTLAFTDYLLAKIN
jgi:hypothetical protein